MHAEARLEENRETSPQRSREWPGLAATPGCKALFVDYAVGSQQLALASPTNPPFPANLGTTPFPANLLFQSMACSGRFPMKQAGNARPEGSGGRRWLCRCCPRQGHCCEQCHGALACSEPAVAADTTAQVATGSLTRRQANPAHRQR
mmetsp:Transcript_537/g.1284  ORF Transcript_537/g.1284 Transcript_537/m.1284 type:complete len:148 (+) Transcript_537:2892-3335(+)